MSEGLIPLAVPNLTGKEVAYVSQVIQQEWVSTAGAQIKQFEKKLAQYVGADLSCACQSGTAGLHLCLRHFGIGKGDRVLVPTLTFIAPINAIAYEGAVPVFFDCDETLCIDTLQVTQYLEEACEWDGKQLIEKESGARVRAIIPVHIFGELCDMEKIMQLARQYQLIVIEDATEALGSTFATGPYKGRHAGTVGDAGVYSFNGNKMITTGGGGMIVSADEQAIAHMQYLSQQAKDDVVYFVHNEIGYNYRMTNLQAALGLAQLERLEEFIQIKQKNWAHYRSRLVEWPLGELVPFASGLCANHWFYTLRLQPESVGRRDEIIAKLQEKGIQTRPIWQLNHLQKPYRKMRQMGCECAQRKWQETINLPCSTSLTEVEVQRVCEVLWELV